MLMASPASHREDSADGVASRIRSGERTGIGWRRLLDQYFYFLMSLFMALVVLYGFSRTVGDKLLHPAIPRPFILYLHAWVFSGWVAFFVFQTAMVRTSHLRWHRMAGRFGAALGASVFVVGISTAITMARFNIAHFQSRYAALALLVSWYDITAFAIPFALAIYWRREPERHRRLMLVATAALMAAAFGRFPIPPQLRPPVFFYTAVDSLIVLGMTRDWMVTGRVHRVYLGALAAFLMCQAAVVHALYQHSPYWLRITHLIVD